MSLLKTTYNKAVKQFMKIFKLSSLFIALSIVILLMRKMLNDNSLFIWHNATFNKVMRGLAKVPHANSNLPGILLTVVVGFWFILIAYPALNDRLRSSDNWFLKTIYSLYADYFVVFSSGKVRLPYNLITYSSFIESFAKKTGEAFWFIISLGIFCFVLDGSSVALSWPGILILVVGAFIIFVQLILYFDMAEGYLNVATYSEWRSSFDGLLHFEGTFENEHGSLQLFGAKNAEIYYVVFFNDYSYQIPNSETGAAALHHFTSYGDAHAYIMDLVDNYMVLDGNSHSTNSNM